MTAMRIAAGIQAENPVAVGDLRPGDIVTYAFKGKTTPVVLKKGTIIYIQDEVDGFDVCIERTEKKTDKLVQRLIKSSFITDVERPDTDDPEVTSETGLTSESIASETLVDQVLAEIPFAKDGEKMDAVKVADTELCFYKRLVGNVVKGEETHINSMMVSIKKRLAKAIEKKRLKGERSQKAAVQARVNANRQKEKAAWIKEIFTRELENTKHSTIKALAPDGSRWPSLVEFDKEVGVRLDTWKEKEEVDDVAAIAKKRDEIRLVLLSECIPQLATCEADEYCGLFKALKGSVPKITDEHFYQLDEKRCEFKERKRSLDTPGSPSNRTLSTVDEDNCPGAPKKMRVE
jgi:hypothetical protein